MQVIDLTPTQAESHQRAKRFRAEIARRASELKPQAVATKIAPAAAFEPQTPVKAELPRYHEMWFYDLILAAESHVPGVSQPPRVTIIDIQRAVCQHYGVALKDVLSDRRSANIVRPRQVGYYLCKVMTARSLPEIGRKFGGRDHTTALHGVRKIEHLLKKDLALAGDVESIRLMVEARRA